MAGNLSASLSISGTRSHSDINYNMGLSHLCESEYRGRITFLIKFHRLIVIKMSSVNVSSWLSNSGLETVSASLVIGEGEEGVWRTYRHTNSFWAHWQPSHNWQLWNTIISVICLRIHQRLHRPVKTFTDRRGGKEGGREGRLRWLNEILILSSRLFTLNYCERIIFSVVFLY